MGTYSNSPFKCPITNIFLNPKYQNLIYTLVKVPADIDYTTATSIYFVIWYSKIVITVTLFAHMRQFFYPQKMNRVVRTRATFCIFWYFLWQMLFVLLKIKANLKYVFEPKEEKRGLCCENILNHNYNLLWENIWHSGIKNILIYV